MAKRTQNKKTNTNKYKTLYKLLKKRLRTQNINHYKSNYQFCPKKIYQNYDKNQIKAKSLKLNKIKYFSINKLKKIINNLNASKYKKKSKPDKHVNKIVYSEIGNQISGTKLFQCVNNSIDNINKTWPNYKINLLKEDLDNIDYSNFNFNNPLSNLKIDSFLDLLLTPSNDYKTSNKNIKILGIKNCTEIPLVEGIKFIDPKSNKEIVFNKEFIKRKITTNIGIINSFYKMIQKFTDITHLELNQLIKKINDMIDSTYIYFCDMPINICGITISNGNIYITGDYLYEALGETYDYKNLKDQNDKLHYKFTAICKIYLTLLHEFGHKLHYIIRKKQKKNEDWKNNFFDHSEEVNPRNELEYFIDLKIGSYSSQSSNDFINLHQNNKLDESGVFFDRELYLGTIISDVDENICDFFLSKRCSKNREYIKKLNHIKNNINIATRSSNSKFKIEVNSSRCHFSNLRHN